jgi:ribosomal protein S21
MAKVKVREGQDLETTLSIFNREVRNEGIIGEIRKRKYYLSPAEKRREKDKIARDRKAKSRKKRF